MANYSVNITNGSGSSYMKSGTYSVSVSAYGYDPTTLTPTTYTATDTTGTGNFTVEANGTLTFIVNEDGAAGASTLITDGYIVMTNADGSATYGLPIRIENGIAVFPNVPYVDGTGYPLYFKQTSSDGMHNPYDGVITVIMDAATKTVYVQNTPIADQTFTLYNANYTGLPVGNATMLFIGE